MSNISKISSNSGEISELIVSPDGALIAYAGNDGKIHVKNVINDEISEVSFPHNAIPVAFSAEKTLLLESRRNDIYNKFDDIYNIFDFYLFDVESESINHIDIEFSNAIFGRASRSAADISPDGTTILFKGQLVSLWDIESEKTKALNFAALSLLDIESGKTKALNFAPLGRAPFASPKAAFSPDGSKVLYREAHYNGFPQYGIFLYDIENEEHVQLDVAKNGNVSSASSFGGMFSPDGTKVIFYSTDTRLVGLEPNGKQHVFLKDLTNGDLEIISISDSGELANAHTFSTDVSVDNNYVLFNSNATNLVSADTNNVSDVFAKDLQTGEMHRLSRATDGTEGNGESYYGYFLHNSNNIIFVSTASNFVVDDAENTTDIFLKDSQFPLENYQLEITDFDVVTQADPTVSILAPDVVFSNNIPASVSVVTEKLNASETTPALLLASVDNGLSSFSARSESVARLVYQPDATSSISTNVGNSGFLRYSASVADGSQTLDLSAVKSALQPDIIPDAAWDSIFANFSKDLNTTSSLSAQLAVSASQLEKMGGDRHDANAALQFSLDLADDFGSISARNTSGVLGKGWSSIADIRLVENGQNIVIEGLADASTIASLDVNQVGSYTLSNPLNKAIDQSGGLSSSGAWQQPEFQNGRTVSGNLRLEHRGEAYELYDPDGSVLLFDKDGILQSILPRVGSQIDVEYDESGVVSAYRNANGEFLEFSYNQQGNLISAKDTYGQEASFSYAQADNVLVNVASKQSVADFSYSAFFGGYLSNSSQKGGAKISLAYDQNGRLSAYSNGGLEREFYSYNERGEISIANGTGSENIIQIGQGGAVHSVSNTLGQTVTVDNDPRASTINYVNGNAVENIYEDGRLIQTTDSGGQTHQFEYDNPDFDVVTRFTDSNGGAREYDYTDGGKLREATWLDGTSYQYTHDEKGNLTSVTNRLEEEIIFSRDTLGRLVTRSGDAIDDTMYSYDAAGNVTAIANAAGVTSLTYDGADRVTSITFPDGRSLAYSYDAAGRRTSMTDQNDNQTFYTYDAAGRLASVADDTDNVVTYAYDVAGRLISKAHRNGTSTDYNYDDAGQVTRIAFSNADGVYAYENHTYDLLGKRVAIETQEGAWEYSYDPSGQLIKADFVSVDPDIDTISLEYRYDNNGNRISIIENGVIIDYTPNQLNQYDAVGNTTQSYDAAGNLITRIYDDGQDSFTYDGNNRMVEATLRDGTSLIYEYDAFGNRSAVTKDGVRTEYLNDPFGMGDVVASYDAAGAETAHYIHGLGLAGKHTANSEYFFDTNATGSVVALTDGAGDRVNHYGYTPFGNELFEVETIANDFEFNGAFGVMEDNDAMHYMRARQYDTETGRFHAEDPLWLADGDIGNLYRFAFNDPVSFVDPNGEFAFIQLAIAAGGFAYGFYKGLEINDTYKSDGAAAAAGEFANAAIPLTSHAIAGSLAFRSPWGSLGVGAGWVVGVLWDELNPVSEANAGTNILPAPPPRPGRIWGDPHYETFDGLGYSFQAVGEFTLIESTVDDFVIQVRQEPWQDSRNVSVNTALALRSQEDTVEIRAENSATVLLNGRTVALDETSPVFFDDGIVTRSGDAITITTNQGNGATIDLNDGWLDALPFLDETMEAQVQGLLGNYDGNPQNDLALKDGTVLANPVPLSVLYGAFADNWRITNQSSLFTYRRGTATEDYTDDNFPSEIITLDDLDPQLRAEAEKIALDAGLEEGSFIFNTTVLDLVVTGNTDFVPSQVFIATQTNDITPITQQLPPNPVNDIASLAQDTTLLLDVLANDTDPENDTLLLISAESQPNMAVSLQENQLFIDPDDGFLGDATIEYIVSDGQGNEATGTVELTVTAKQNSDVTEIIEGTAGQDTLIGNASDDTILSFGKDDLIYANEGNDSVIGHGGADTIWGWTGDDTLLGHSGDDMIGGDQGNDSILAGSGDDSVYGWEGNDYLSGYHGDDLLMGELGDDTIHGGSGDDSLYGGAGRDVLRGDEGRDMFIFEHKSHSVNGSADRIKDFEIGADNIILFGLGYTGVVTENATEGELRLTYSEASNRTYIRDDFSEFDIALDGGDFRLTLSNDDFVF